MNAKSPMISPAPPFVLRLSKDERRVFQQNRKKYSDPTWALEWGSFIFLSPASDFGLRGRFSIVGRV